MALKMPSELNPVPRRQRSGPNMQARQTRPSDRGAQGGGRQPGGDGAENAIRAQPGAKEAKIRAQHASEKKKALGQRGTGVAADSLVVMALKMASELNPVPRRQRSGPNIQARQTRPLDRGAEGGGRQPGGDGSENAIRAQPGAKEAKIRAQHPSETNKALGQRGSGSTRYQGGKDHQNDPAATEEPAALAMLNGLDNKNRRLAQSVQGQPLSAGLHASGVSGASTLEPPEAPLAAPPDLPNDSCIGVSSGEDGELYGGCTGNGPDQDVSCDKGLARMPVFTPAEEPKPKKRLERAEPLIGYFPLTGATWPAGRFPLSRSCHKVEFLEKDVFGSVLSCSQSPLQTAARRTRSWDERSQGVEGPGPGMNTPGVRLPPMTYQPRLKT
ncbi:hypothetical protein BSKO_00243 [Bryopsis sp. KO-2023]|nr:hypothetical protein BSKO_00243 [Bryopsis sp. KO-2023]